MRIIKMNNKYILDDGNFISSITETFIDTLFVTNSNGKIFYPLNYCDKFDD